jgi:N-acetylmuramoyl-L-alanine amidase
VQQKHTHDKLFINIILLFLWCNPFYWLIRKEVNLIHEFIADKAAIEDNDTAAFAHMILQAAYPRQQFHLTNPFFYSPIKRRLSMLTKNNKSKVGYIGRVLVLPLLLLIFAAFSFKTKTINQHLNHPVNKPLTIVINAGHGGKDLGAIASNGESEKDITIAIAKKIQQLNQNKQLQILLIREKDEYLSPQQIVDMTTKAGADLFIALHVDALPEKNSKTGMTFWIPNNDFPKFDASKLLGEALLAQFKNNYGLYVYDNLNQREKKAWVLHKNKCPAILIETGFMSNDKDVAYLTNETNQEQIARNILIGIESYATNMKKLAGVSTKETNTATMVQETPAKESINFSAKKFVLQNDTQNGQNPVSSMSGNVKMEKKDTDKMLLIVNGEKMTGSTLHDISIKGTTASVYSAGNKEAIDRYGAEAANGVLILNNATITKNSSPGNKGIMIEMDSLTVFGAASINPQDQSQKNIPLYVVDGLVKTKAFVASIAPDDIAKIDVLKDKAAIDKYGQPGKNGVVEITLKKVLPYREMPDQEKPKQKVKPTFHSLTKA